MAGDTLDTIRVDDSNRVRTITLDRPEARNAFNDAMYDRVREVLLDSQHDDGIACVVLTGQGSTFSAGQDLAEADCAPGPGDEHGFVPFIEVVAGFDKPLLAAVNGPAIGVGLTMLLHVDLVVMAHSARLRAPFVGLGITMEAGSSYLLPQSIGWQHTAHMLLTGAWVDAKEAVDQGLAWRCVEDDDLMETTLTVAAQMATMPISSLRTTKRLLLASRVDASRAAREREYEALAALAGGPAQQEALAAFRERREPDFAGLPSE